MDFGKEMSDIHRRVEAYCNALNLASALRERITEGDHYVGEEQFADFVHVIIAAARYNPRDVIDILENLVQIEMERQELDEAA